MVSPTPFRLSRLTRNYDLLSWVARLFLGGAFNIYPVQQLFGDFVQQNTQCNPSTGVCTTSVLVRQPVETWGLVSAIVLSPLVASLFLSKRTPELRIVPPFYIEMITTSWFIVFGLIRWSPDITFVYLGFFSLLGIGLLEDRIVTSVLGRSVDREDLQLFKFQAPVSVARVMQVLAPPEIRATLRLRQRNEEIPHGFRITSPRATNYRTVMKLERSSAKDETEISMVTYEVARYQIRATPELVHFSLMLRAYLMEVFKNSGIEVKDVEVSNKYLEPLVNETFNETQGFYAQSKQMSVPDWLKIAFLVGILIATGTSFFLGAFVQAGILGLVDALFAASELPELLRRRRG